MNIKRTFHALGVMLVLSLLIVPAGPRSAAPVYPDVWPSLTIPSGEC